MSGTGASTAPNAGCRGGTRRVDGRSEGTATWFLNGRDAWAHPTFQGRSTARSAGGSLVGLHALGSTDASRGRPAQVVDQSARSHGGRRSRAHPCRERDVRLHLRRELANEVDAPRSTLPRATCASARRPNGCRAWATRRGLRRRCRNAGGRSLVILSVTPAVRSNSGPTSASTVAIALVVQTTSSGRCCAVAGVGTAPAMATKAIVRPASRLTIRERQRGRPSAQCDAEERM
jgi:hypothetical protein